MASNNANTTGLFSGSHRPGRSRPPKQHASNNPAIRLLMQEFQSLQKETNEGFQVKLLRDDNMFEWDVAIFGPPDTLYAGGYFRALMKFPSEYPFSPPSVKFVNKIWHPNIYDNGNVCISILHPASNDTRSGELPCERWNPTQNAHSVIMSIISLLSEPNTSSPANVDAGIMYRRWKEQKDKEYERTVKEQVEASKADAEKDGVKVPTTVQEYCVKSTFQVNKEESVRPSGRTASNGSYTAFDVTDDVDLDVAVDHDDASLQVVRSR
ncbi:hypothetical protein RvY_04134 [Ramazzottius varieornatus]|uniref:UBC core domain-containing protein n=1 Tax=Ramazzottius varieornatus TaxID=947166 RepID=A0A1D1UR89_RAMVA|nr:hypothetical protein RvY_04134 [Ramazzottius varieornatus]